MKFSHGTGNLSESFVGKPTVSNGGVIRDLWIFGYLGLGQVFSFPNPEVLVIFRLEHPKFDTTNDY